MNYMKKAIMNRRQGLLKPEDYSIDEAPVEAVPAEGDDSGISSSMADGDLGGDMESTPEMEEIKKDLSEKEMEDEERELGNAPTVRDRSPDGGSTDEMENLTKIFDPGDLNNRGFKGKAARAMKAKMDMLAKK